MERRLLNGLYGHTFGSARGGEAVVLDIEVDLNGNVGGGKKCDLVLLNPEDALMFVEGKVFFDSRVMVACGFIPEVIGQVETYTAAIAEQRQTILEQYGEHIRIVNSLFGTTYREPKKLIEPAKLLVYETDFSTENRRYSVQIINEKLGAGNVAWFKQGETPSPDEIWRALSGGSTCK